MAGNSAQLILESWLDDQNGPAKLTPRQRALIADMEEIQRPRDVLESTFQQQGNVTTTSDSIINPLEPKWQANDVIRMFYEERDKNGARGDDCKGLLTNADSVLKEILILKNLHLYISPKTSQLHSECKTIIQERNDLRESYDKISTTLNKQKELRSIFKRMPDIKSQIVTVLESVFQGYQTRQQQQEGGAPLDEYYGRFYIECRRIKELTIQLESCLSSTNTDELLLHLEEIYTVYFDIREQLIEPVFTKTLRNLVAAAGRNYCDLLRQTSSILVRISRNEIQLSHQIFPSPPSATTEQGEHPVKKQILNRFLELMCNIFYEHLRPVVIHVNHLETLAELYKLITETIRPEVSEESYQVTMSTLAEDVQERMVFRVEVFIQESVLDYKPSSGDLAYPEILEIVGAGELKDFQSLWYPTVQRTVLTLVYLNRVFDPISFREMAQEVVLACFKSIDVAQRLIDERHGGTKIEASLFLSKHLAIIKDQLLSYGIERISFQAQSKNDTETASKLVEINTASLEALMKLFQDNEFCGLTSDSLWTQLNETILSGTRWTLRAARLRKG